MTRQHDRAAAGNILLQDFRDVDGRNRVDGFERFVEDEQTR
jgi:hypothetical protein